MNEQRRDFLKTTVALAATVGLAPMSEALAQAKSSIEAQDRVFITNEDSNTLVVIDPRSNTVESTINLTSFDEDARPPFRFVTAGVAPTHAAMIHKPLYHGCIDAHGAVPSPDGKLLATSGRGSSNIYLIDAVNKRVVGNTPNPAAGPTTNPERLSSGILVGREPHEPTFTRNGKELWVTLRGEDRIAILDVERAQKQAGGTDAGMNYQQAQRLIQAIEVSLGDFIVRVAQVPPGLPLEVAFEDLAFLEGQRHFFRCFLRSWSRMPCISSSE